MSGNMGPGGGMRPGGMGPGMGPGRGPGMGPGMGPGFGPGRGPGMGPGFGPGRGPGIPGGRRPPPRPIPIPVPIPPIPPPDLRPRGYDPYLRYRPLNIYLCREPDTRTGRTVCHYTVAYGDAIAPMRLECMQMVAGPFYTMLECDEYIESRFGVRRGDYFEC